MKPRWSRFEWTRTTPSANPTEAPRRKPTKASLAVKRAASPSTSMSSGPFRRDGSNSCPMMSWMCGRVRSLTGKGHVRPTASAAFLYASQRPQSPARTPTKTEARRSIALFTNTFGVEGGKGLAEDGRVELEPALERLGNTPCRSVLGSCHYPGGSGQQGNLVREGAMCPD